MMTVKQNASLRMNDAQNKTWSSFNGGSGWEEYVSAQLYPILYGLEKNTVPEDKEVIDRIIDSLTGIALHGADTAAEVQALWMDYYMNIRPAISDSRIIHSLDWLLYSARKYTLQNAVQTK